MQAKIMYGNAKKNMDDMFLIQWNFSHFLQRTRQNFTS
jgi:hypothetical protein